MAKTISTVVEKANVPNWALRAVVSSRTGEKDALEERIHGEGASNNATIMLPVGNAVIRIEPARDPMPKYTKYRFWHIYLVCIGAVCIEIGRSPSSTPWKKENRPVYALIGWGPRIKIHTHMAPAPTRVVQCLGMVSSHQALQAAGSESSTEEGGET